MSSSDESGAPKAPDDLKATLASRLPEAAKAALDEAAKSVAEANGEAKEPPNGDAKPDANEAKTDAHETKSDTPPPSASVDVEVSVLRGPIVPAAAIVIGDPAPPVKSPSSKPPPVPAKRAGSATLIGITNPPPIVPRRRTPMSGTPAPLPHEHGRANTMIAAVPPVPRMTPAAGTPAPGAYVPKIAVQKQPSSPPSTISPDGGVIESDRESPNPPPPPDHTIPPIVRIPQGGLLGASTTTKPERSGSLLCEVLVKNGSVTQEAVDRAIAIQEERGGQIGRILVSIGACSEEAIARGLIDQLKVRKQSGYLTDISAAARENKDVAGLKVLTSPTRTVLTLFTVDLVSLFLAAFLATGVHWARTYEELGGIDWSAWLVVGPAIALCVLTYLGLELYSPMAKSTPDEIRDVVFSTSLVHLGASLLSTLGNLPIVKWGVFVRGVWWLATLFLVPVLRALVRGKLSIQPWWGIPVCVLGAAKTGRLIVRTLKAQPRSGLKPVMLLDDDKEKHGTLRASFTNEVMDVYSVNVSAAHFMSDSQRQALSDDLFGPEGDASTGPISSDHIPVPPSSWHSRVDVTGGTTSDEHQFLGPESQKPRGGAPRLTRDASEFPRGKFAEVDGVPVVGDLSLAPILAQRLKIPYAVLAMPGVEGPKLLQIVERVGGKFSHLLVIPDLFGFATLGVPAKNLGGILGVEVRQQLLLPGPRLAKRVMDVALTSMGALFVLPFLALIALLIKLDSKGPIFYTQKRLGKDGEHFRAYKFRTMHGDGEERLKAILDADPALRAEYEIYHKLKKDPRVTRIGRVLRKFSLDEFPQLLNVINGDMSLVGPRPYIERELTEMGGQEKIILRAPPGMTGMWQVSDRNATSFAQRVQIDVYYVRNWSPWLDIHILAKTFGVVIKGSGV
ncbi:MAG: exopolysaccharide biosynthesis polyprenyl glycosylphosphotransferase [Labilithrix sp.]|nr:exopolysaccharide biosynthesis polyprenyl glycosylphosphotransferase [Labilithrix sp.]